MDQYIDQIGMFIEANQVWAGPITFLLTLGESLVLVGLFIPATALMLLTGGLIGAGTLDPWNVLAWGVAGAIVGDARPTGWAAGPARRAAPLAAQTATHGGGARQAVLLPLWLRLGADRPVPRADPFHHPHRGRRHGHGAWPLPAGQCVLRHPVDAADAGARYVTARSLGSAENAQQIAMLIGAGFRCCWASGCWSPCCAKGKPQQPRSATRPL